MRNFWRNRDIILMLALVLGLGLGQFAVYTEKLVLPALGVVMTLSVLEVPVTIFRHWSSLLRATAAGLGMSFLLLGGLLLLLSRLAIREQELVNGFIILASVPPAVAVIPFTRFLEGDERFTLLGAVGCYLAALVLTPLLSLLLLEGGVLVQPQQIAIIVAKLILLPLLLSWLLQWLNWAEKIAPYKGALTNWSFFLITFTIVGLNRQLFLHQPLTLLPVFAIALCSTFLWGEIVERFCRWQKLEHPLMVSLVLLGTLKNYGLAGGLALTLFSTQTSVPAAVSTVFMIVYVIWLNAKKRWFWSNQTQPATLNI